MKKFLPLLAGILLIPFSKSTAQSFYAIDTIQQIEVLFAQSNWDYILDTAKQGSDSYTMATWVKINGVQFDSAGVKYKGNSSYNPNNLKNPLHIELDHFKQQDYNGIKDIKLSNGFHEPSSVREVLLYSIARQYMPASKANYAQVSINGSLMGLYTNVEAITKTFLDDRFYSDNNTFVFADNGGCNLVYKGNDTTQYYSPYTLKSDHGWNNLASLCGTLRNNISSIENILDVDRALWMLAFTNITVTLDSYIGQSTHNYYLYQDHNNRFNPILWDLNGGFGVFSKIGMGPQLNVAQMQVLQPMVHANDTLWPLVKNILAVPMYKRMYIAHLKTILNENFADSSYYFNALHLQGIIDSEVQADPNAFYTHSEFLSNITTDVIDGPKTLPGITNLMEARKAFLNSTPEFQMVSPVINSVSVSDTLPLLNTSVNVTANVTNASAVFLGTRYSVMDKFSRIPMFDDGLHADGSAGDNVYGTSLPVSATAVQYYIYAENNNAGIFSPQRAEYEYYTLNTQRGIVINELMADNQLTQPDNYNEYNDWIELYNNSASPLNLGGYFLSDEGSNPSKWMIPAGTTIGPNDFLIIWTDSDSTQSGLHTNFKLSASGERILLSNPSMQLIDEVTYPGINADVTYGRYPNGTGPFAFLASSYNAVNSPPISVNEIKQSRYFNLYPNPASDLITIETGSNEDQTYQVCNLMGSVMAEGMFRGRATINISTYSNGIYFARSNGEVKKFIVNH